MANDDLNRRMIGDLTRRQILRRGSYAAAGMSAMGILAACGGGGSSTSATTGSGGETTTEGEAGGSTTELKMMNQYIANILAFERMNEAITEAVEQLKGVGKETSWTGADPQELLSQAESFKALGVNAAFSFTSVDTSCPPMAKLLAEDEIFYQNFSNWLPWFSPSDPKFNNYYIGSFKGSFAEEGLTVGRLICEAGEGGGKAIYLRGAKGSTADTERNYGMQLALKEFPEVEVVATAYTEFDTTKAQEALTQLLPANPDAKYIICLNDGIAIGALAALKAVNNTDALVCGFDGDPSFLEAMTQDERVVGTSAGIIAFSGVLAAVRLFDALNGVERNPLEDFILTDSLVVDTPEAAEALLKLADPNKPIPWDPTKMSKTIQGDKWTTPQKILVGDPTNFNWGAEPGTNPVPRPNGFKWPPAYQEALDKGEVASLNKELESHYQDIYGPVREKDKTKESSVLGLFEREGLTGGE